MRDENAPLQESSWCRRRTMVEVKWAGLRRDQRLATGGMGSQQSPTETRLERPNKVERRKSRIERRETGTVKSKGRECEKAILLRFNAESKRKVAEVSEVMRSIERACDGTSQW